MSTPFVALILFTALLNAGPLPIEPGKQRPTPLRTEVDLVLVSANVIDQKGATVTGLRREDFSILEDKVQQPIVSFSVQDAPCSVGVILDVSGSMRKTLNSAKAALTGFLKSANPEDEFFLLTVSTRPEISYGSFADANVLLQNVQLPRAGGNTALIDTVYMGLNRSRSARYNRRALLLISDGMDNHSRYSKAELMRIAMESDAQIYTVAIREAQPNKKAIELHEERKGLALLQDLSEKTGGLHFVITRPGEINEAITKIGAALRNQYVIGYRPQAPEESGRWHSIKVKVNLRNASVRARDGYFR